MISQPPGQTRRRGMAQDEGASLVIALIITTVVALVVGAVLGLSGASVDATVATTTQARSTAAVDAAAQVAINTVQNNTYNNDVASATYPKCFGNTGTSDSMVVPYPGGGGSTYVTCAPDPGSGAAVRVGAGHRPEQAWASDPHPRDVGCSDRRRPELRPVQQGHLRPGRRAVEF